MTYQFDLPHRAARCVEYASYGNAVILKVVEKEREEAKKLIGEAPVIVATGKETIEFLKRWMAPMFKRRK